eukprot:g109.t1
MIRRFVTAILILPLSCFIKYAYGAATPGDTCSNPIEITSDNTLIDGTISPGKIVYYSYNMGAGGKALVFEIFPSIKDDYIEMEMSQAAANGCPGNFISCNTQGLCPDNVQESERKFFQAGLFNIAETERIAVGVNQPALVLGGTWVLAVRGKIKHSFNGPRGFKLNVKVGINACRIPQKHDFNDNMCLKYINYPVLDVSLLQRDVQSPHIALSVNDPRGWMKECRANVDNLYCYQTFLKCDEEDGIGIKLCKSSCYPMNVACRKSENETIPNLQKLDNIVCKTPERVANATFFSSRFSNAESDCLKVEGVNSYSDLDIKIPHGVSTVTFELIIAMCVVIVITILSYVIYSLSRKKSRYGDLQKLTNDHTDNSISTDGGGKHSYIEESTGFEIAEI